jgi:hypothetical protein
LTKRSTRSRTRVSERAQRGLLAALGQALVEGPAGALQRAVHRGDRRLEHQRDLPGREAQYVSQNEHGALLRRQVLQGRDERELYGLLLLVAGLRRRRPILESQLLVGERLGPHRLRR